MCAGSETHAVGTKVFVKDASGAWVRGVVTGIAGNQLVVQDDSGQQLECAPAAAPLQNVQQDAVEVGIQQGRGLSVNKHMSAACVAGCSCMCGPLQQQRRHKPTAGWVPQQHPPDASVQWTLHAGVSHHLHVSECHAGLPHLVPLACPCQLPLGGSTPDAASPSSIITGHRAAPITGQRAAGATITMLCSSSAWPHGAAGPSHCMVCLPGRT